MNESSVGHLIHPKADQELIYKCAKLCFFDYTITDVIHVLTLLSVTIQRGQSKCKLSLFITLFSMTFNVYKNLFDLFAVLLSSKIFN